MIYVWLLVGILGVAIAFFIPDSTNDLWPALNAAGIALIVYLLALLAYTLRPPIVLHRRVLAGSVAIITLVAGLSVWTGHQEQAQYQHDKLLEIRSTIGRGILLNEVPGMLLPVLEAYHGQGARKNRSIGKIFSEMYDGAEVGRNVRTPNFENDTQRVYIPLRLEDDLVELAAIDFVGRGKDLTYANTGGGVGRIEERFTLTGKGVRHDVLN